MPLSGTSEGCNAHTLLDYLAQRGLTSYGQSDLDGSLTDRNRDRLRILRYLSQHPEGTTLTALTHDTLKGVDPSTYTGHFSFDTSTDWQDRVWHHQDWVALDGSDQDYQFARRFVDDLEDNTDLITRVNRQDDDSEQQFLAPTPELLDLISEGITETASQSDELVYDREFCANLLKSKRSRYKRLTDNEKNLLASSLRRYIQRTKDYRLAFDVHLANRTGYDVRRMEKPFSTRFTDEGRIDKNFAMLQSALEAGYADADTAVFCTLTTDPKRFDSLYEAITKINENFHTLTQWLKSDPKHADDTRLDHVPAWKPRLDSSNYHYFHGEPAGGPAAGPVTSRPRERLDYIKVLEFTEAGYPHLHVLFFDPPRREKDGMPWLCDKAELSDKWRQGDIVDTWPLVYRDDLEDCDAEFNDGEGFVSWYRYGDHDHGDDWIADRAQQHDQIDFHGDDDNPMEKTAGAYIGKYVAETQALLKNTESLDDPEFDPAHDGKSAWWKLALYWITERRFWSPSRRIRQLIKLDHDRTNIRRGVADATRTTLERLTRDLDDGHACYPDHSDDELSDYLGLLARDLVAESDVHHTEASESQTTLARVEYLGAFHHADMPASPHQRVDHRPLEAAVNTERSGVALASTGDRPPPAADAWT